MSDDARIVIFDTTLRDGEQAPGFTMDVPDKVTMARALDAHGVDIIAGASAGGINGTMLARALSHDLPMNALRSLWLDNADVSVLLAPEAKAGQPGALQAATVLYRGDAS